MFAHISKNARSGAGSAISLRHTKIFSNSITGEVSRTVRPQSFSAGVRSHAQRDAESLLNEGDLQPDIVGRVVDLNRRPPVSVAAASIRARSALVRG